MYVIANYNLFRSDDEKYSLRIINKEKHDYRSTRRVISLKICFIGWFLEVVGLISIAMAPNFYELGLSNPHYPNVIIMFIVIPFLHLMNDQDIKSAIYDHGWYYGIKQMFTL